jgi:phosphoglycolate phosphatase
LNRVRLARGLDPVPLARLRPYASHGARGLLGAGMGVTPDHPDYTALRDDFLVQYEAALCVETTLFSAIGAVLDAIEARSLAWGIVTNKATRFTLPLLESLGLAGRAGAVVCGDTTRFAKPHPAPLLAAAERLAVDPGRCVYVGDAERDITAGVAAGMRTIVACYGYIEPDDVPNAWPADGVVADPAELLAWLPSGRSP